MTFDSSRYAVEYVALNAGFQMPSGEIPTSIRTGEGITVELDGEYLFVRDTKYPGRVSLIPLSATKGVSLAEKPQALPDTATTTVPLAVAIAETKPQPNGKGKRA